MSKRIIFCADGTWDSVQNDTNVYKLFKAISTASDQVSFYDDGVGSDGAPLEKLAGGAFGEGIFQKIRDGYTKIAHVYFPARCLNRYGFPASTVISVEDTPKPASLTSHSVG